MTDIYIQGKPFGYGEIIVRTQTVYPFAIVPHLLEGTPSGYYSKIEVLSSEEENTSVAWNFVEGDYSDDPTHVCLEANDYVTMFEGTDDEKQIRVCNQDWKWKITPGSNFRKKDD